MITSLSRSEFLIFLVLLLVLLDPERGELQRQLFEEGSQSGQPGQHTEQTSARLVRQLKLLQARIEEKEVRLKASPLL